MADFPFWASLEDRLAILQGILNLGEYQFIGNRNYPTPSQSTFSRLDQALLDNISINKLLYISGPFTTQPISFQEIRLGAYDGTFVIKPETGGQLLTLLLPYCGLKDSIIQLRPGHFSYPRCYWDETSTRPIAPNLELKHAYERIKKEIKKNLFRSKELGAWIGLHAWKLVMEEEAALFIRGKKLTKENLQ